MKERTRDQQIELMRVLAAFAVVILHASAPLVTEQPVGSPTWWFGTLVNACSRWCVPVFVMISGFLLGQRALTENVFDFSKKRVGHILPALLFWTLMFLIWKLIKLVLRGQSISVYDIVWSLAIGEPYYHLWYLFMMLGMYCAMPYIFRMISAGSRREANAFLVLSFGLSMAFQARQTLMMEEKPLWILRFLTYVPYVLLGPELFLKKKLKDANRNLLSLLFLTFVAALGCCLLSSHSGIAIGLYFLTDLSVCVVPLSIFAFALLRDIKIPDRLAPLIMFIGRLSFGLYLLHPLFLEVVSFVMREYAGHDAIVVLFCSILVAIFGGLCLTWLLSRCSSTARLVGL